MKRRAPAVLKHSGLGDSRANGATEQVVQALSAQIRVAMFRLESHLGVNIKGSHT